MQEPKNFFQGDCSLLPLAVGYLATENVRNLPYMKGTGTLAL